MLPRVTGQGRVQGGISCSEGNEKHRGWLIPRGPNSMTQISHRRKIGVLPLLSGILALVAEATVLAALMVIAGIVAVGWGLIEMCNPGRKDRGLAFPLPAVSRSRARAGGYATPFNV